MNEKLLGLANKYYKEGMWDEVINYYEQYTSNNNILPDIHYVAYAKSLKMIGRTNDAKLILEKAEEFYPNNEIILVELLDLFDNISDWKSAKFIGETLINNFPYNAEYFFRLGRINIYLKDKQKAKQLYLEGLTKVHGLSIEQLIKKVQNRIIDKSAFNNSEYILLGGRNNLGVFLHKFKNKIYMTKISRVTRGTEREGIFYQKVIEQFPILKDITPQFIDLITFDQIQYLTIEMLNHNKNEIILQNVIDTSQIISTVTFNEIVNTYPNFNHRLQLKNRTNYITIYFTQIHKEYNNKRLFSDLILFSEQYSYSLHIIKLIKHLKKLILNNELYKYINPENHYTLLHGDFSPSNMRLNHMNKSLKIFDWATFKIGPHFLDLSRYFTITKTKYDIIKNNYLYNKYNKRVLSDIEKIFFIYSFICYHLISLNKKNEMIILSNYIFPALIDLELHIKQFKNEKPYVSHELVKLLIIENNNLLIKNKRLQKQSRQIKRKVKNLETRLKDLLNSKSWRYTAPFRRSKSKPPK